jgi:hypothetical protein
VSEGASEVFYSYKNPMINVLGHCGPVLRIYRIIWAIKLYDIVITVRQWWRIRLTATKGR